MRYASYMRTYLIEQTSGIDSLTMTQRPAPKMGPGEVLLGIRAVSLNYRDLLVVRGGYGRGIQLPLTPCSDAAGEVLQTGEGVKGLRPGDRVATLFMQRWLAGELTAEAMGSALGGAVDGVLAEQAVFSADGLVPIPGHLSFEEGATLPCAALTAWNALFASGDLQPGQTVLTLGSGGVSVFALQFAKLAGATVIATSSTAEKQARLKDLGADQTIDYVEEPQWSRRVRQLTEGNGVDHVIEVGGAGTLEQSFRSARPAGTISVIGVLAGAGEFSPNWIFAKALQLRGIYVGSREMFLEMNRAISASELHPVIDRVFPFEEAREAMRYLESGKHIGKIVLRVG